MLIGEMLSPHVLFVRESDSIRQAVALAQQNRLDALPVVDESGRLAGVLTRSNIFDLVIRGDDPGQPVRSVMVTEPVTILASESFAEAQAHFATSPVGQWVVIDESGMPVGLFTRSTAVNALLKEADHLARNLGAVVDAMDYGVVAVDGVGIITVFNRAAAEFTGIQPEAVLGRAVAEALPLLKLDQIPRTGDALERHRESVGERVLLINSRPVPGPQGPIGSVAVLHDISHLEQIAGELEGVRQLNRTLDTVLEIAYEGIIVVDEAGRVNLVNRSMCDFLGKPAEELIGRPVDEVIENTRLKQVAESGVAEHGDVHVMRGARHVVSRLPIIKDGRPSGAVGKIMFHGLQELRGMVQQMEALERQLEQYRDESRRTHRARYTFDHIVGKSPEMEQALREARRSAFSDAAVLLLGPSGTGKELFAHAIHNAGPRRSTPFVKVNCAAVPGELLESEFFGYEAGAFTGAKSQGKLGKFEVANGGTLFLDEIGDMSLPLQAKLLRVLQDGEFERVGGTRPIRVNVRVVAATNRDLHAMIEAGQFRLDLLYRLNVLTVEIPALARRRVDILPLAHSFVAKYNRELSTQVTGLTPGALRLLQSYDWPGNVRELENVICRAMYRVSGQFIGMEDLPPQLAASVNAKAAESKPAESLSSALAVPLGRSDYHVELERRERELIRLALERCNGNRKQAAAELRISRTTLYEKLQRLGLPTRKS